MYSNELYHGIRFDDIWLAHICGSMRPGKTLYLGGNYNFGDRIARYPRGDGQGDDLGHVADASSPATA